MIDRELEDRIKQLKNFIDLWLIFHDSYKNAMNKASFTEEEEKNFLLLKSNLARKYQALMDLLAIKPTAEDRTYDVISQILSLKGITGLSPMQLQKIDNEWHNSYIALNKIMGTLENKQYEFAKISAAKEFFKKCFTNPFIVLILIIIIIYVIFCIIKR